MEEKTKGRWEGRNGNSNNKKGTRSLMTHSHIARLPRVSWGRCL